MPTFWGLDGHASLQMSIGRYRVPYSEFLAFRLTYQGSTFLRKPPVKKVIISLFIFHVSSHGETRQ